MSTIAFSTTLFNCKGDRLRWQSCWINDPLGSGRPLFCFSSLKLTSWTRTSSEPSQEQRTQNGYLCVHISRLIFISHCQNFFVSIIFVAGWTNKNILTPNFPIYGKVYLSYILGYGLDCGSLKIEFTKFSALEVYITRSLKCVKPMQ